MRRVGIARVFHTAFHGRAQEMCSSTQRRGREFSPQKAREARNRTGRPRSVPRSHPTNVPDSPPPGTYHSTAYEKCGLTRTSHGASTAEPESTGAAALRLIRVLNVPSRTFPRPKRRKPFSTASSTGAGKAAEVHATVRSIYLPPGLTPVPRPCLC